MDVKAIQQKWNNMSTGAKAATVAGATAAVAAAGVTTAAAIRGGKLNKINGDLFEISDKTGKLVKKEGAEQPKLFTTLKEGFKSIFTKEGRKAWNGVAAQGDTPAITGQKAKYAELKEKSEKAIEKLKNQTTEAAPKAPTDDAAQNA